MLNFANGVRAGRMVITKGVDTIGYDIMPLVRRHLAGDWGDVSEAEKALNDEGMRSNGRIHSSYSINGTVFWVITDAGHAVTTVLLPDEY